VSIKEETLLDLFIEQYVIPNIINTIELSYDFLKSNVTKSKALIMDLHGSGEITNLLYQSRQQGIHQIWRKVASPTCRFGVFNSLNKIKKKRKYDLREMSKILKLIKSGKFKSLLDSEANKNFKNLAEYDAKNDKSNFYKDLMSIKNDI